MPLMTVDQLKLLGAGSGSISEITLREATGDRSVTLDRHDKAVLFTRYPDGSFSRKGGAVANGNPDHHDFLVNPHDSLKGAKSRNIYVVHPKKKGNELRLYGGIDAGLDFRAGDLFYIVTRNGEPRPIIGTISPAEWARLQGEPPIVAPAAALDDEDDDAAYQRAIVDAAAKMPVAFVGQRYPRDPRIALVALEAAKFRCEAAPGEEPHATFLTAATGLPYVEAHHLVPLSRQGDYDVNLDIAENITALCPNCHRRLHHAAAADRVHVLVRLLEKRAPQLAAHGLKIDGGNLLKAYGIDAADLLKLLKAA